MSRFHRPILIASVTLGSWLGMQVVHELGHVLAALTSGGQVARVVLHPMTISRTDLAANPRPALVAWAGPIAGVTLPLLAWGVAAALRAPGAFVLRFFAGFCLIANGAYLAFGSIDRVGDAGELIRHGSPPWALWGFGAVAMPAGLWCWHGQARHFGLGRSAGPVAPGVAYGSLVALLGLIALGVVVGGD